MINFSKVQFFVQGMHCVSCAYSIEDKLRKLPGVLSVKVNFSSETASILYDERVSVLILKETIKEIGFSFKNSFIEYESENFKAKFKKKTILSILSVIVYLLIKTLPVHLAFRETILLMYMIGFVIVFCFPFYIKTYKQIQYGILTMDVLIAMSTFFAFVYSVLSYFGTVENFFFDGLFYDAIIWVVVFFYIGKDIELFVKEKSMSQIINLRKKENSFANLLTDKKLKRIPLNLIKRDDFLLVRKGELFPVDGVVQENETYVDESLLTGEVDPKFKGMFDKVVSGSINVGVPITVKAISSVEDSTFSWLIKSVYDSLNSKTHLSSKIDVIISVFIPAILGIAFGSFASWYYLTLDISTSVFYSLLVLIISCPCAIGLSIPTAIASAYNYAIKSQIVFKNTNPLYLIKDVKHIVFDKTGTLTKGKLSLNGIRWTNSSYENKYLPKLIAIEQQFDHPVAETIISAFSNMKMDFKVEKPTYIPGQGVLAKIDKVNYFVGNEKLLKTYTIPFLKKTEFTNSVTLFFANEKGVIAQIKLADNYREGANHTIKKLLNKKIKIHLLSGDGIGNVERMARDLGIKNFCANQLPENKKKYIQALKKDKGVVIMVGDGINDSLALVEADVSISFNNASELSKTSANVILTETNLCLILKLINLSKKTNTIIYQNLFWTFLYNSICIPIAVGFFVNYEVYLTPFIAALAMSLSSISVVLNSLRLNKIQ